MFRKLFFTLLIISACIGTTTLSISVGGFQLSLYRGLLFGSFSIITLFSALNLIKFEYSRNARVLYPLFVFLIWVLYGFLSLIWVKDVSLWFRSFFFIFSGFILLINCLYFIRSKYEMMDYYIVFVFVSFFHNMVGWIEILFDKYFFLHGEKLAIYKLYDYPVSVFGNTNDFATYLLFTSLICFVIIFVSKSIIVKILSSATFTSSLILILMTHSRANLIGLLCGVMLIILLNIGSKKVQKLLLISFVISFFFIVLNSSFLQNLKSILDSLLEFNFGSSGGSDYVRVNLIRNGIIFLKDTYLLGVGAGNIEYWMLHYSVYNTNGVLNIHNWWLEILVGYGVIVFILYISLYFGLILNSFKSYINSSYKGLKSLYLINVTLLFTFFIGGVSSSSLISAEWFWLIFVLIIISDIKTTNITKVK